MPFDRQQPFNDLPALPPAADLESRVILKQAITSNRMLANLRGLAGQIPNQGMAGRCTSSTMRCYANWRAKRKGATGKGPTVATRWIFY
jgi:hypothetical protein